MANFFETDKGFRTMRQIADVLNKIEMHLANEVVCLQAINENLKNMKGL